MNTDPILVVGSMAFDDIETPAGRRDNALGGSASYFSIGASHFAPVRAVAVIGEDFPSEFLRTLEARGVDTKGVERAEGKTFRWRGRYAAEGADAETLETQLNVFEHFRPSLPSGHEQSPMVFLGNIHPALQKEVLDQVEGARLVGADTMNFWIDGEREALLKLISGLDLLVINETEARLLSGERSVYDAADVIRAMGPRHLIIKKGAHGALLFQGETMFSAPAYPLRRVIDPTGAGDTFASGLMGALARERELTPSVWRRAVLTGTTMASFACEGFSFDRVLEVDAAQIEERVRLLESIISVQC